MTISLIQKKGGVGKTTLAILLHLALKEAGVNNAVKDYDPQGSASKALAAFGGVAAEPNVTYDVLIIDSPPNLNFPATSAAALAADTVLIPTGPSPLDLWEADESARFVRSKNPNAHIRILFNRVKSGTLLTEEARKLEFSEPVLKMSLSDWQTYQHATMNGWASLEGKAREELHALALAVTSLR